MRRDNPFKIVFDSRYTAIWHFVSGKLVCALHAGQRTKEKRYIVAYVPYFCRNLVVFALGLLCPVNSK